MKRVLLMSLLAVSGCDFEDAFKTCVMKGNCEDVSSAADGGSDAGFDAGTDAGTQDAGEDAGEDAGADAGTPDAGPPGDGGTLGTPEVCNPQGWCWQTAGPRVELTAVISAGPNEAWAFGREGVAMYFDGRSWRGLPGRTEDLLNAVRFGPRKILVGASTGVFVLDGESWQLIADVIGPVDAVGADPAGELFATTQNGAAWSHSVNGGLDWSNVAGQPSTGNAFTFPSAGRGWASGDQGEMFRRTDGGWTSEMTGSTENLLATWASSEEEVWAGGQQGTLLHRSDGGWEAIRDGGLVGFVTGAIRASNDMWILNNGYELSHWDGITLGPRTDVGPNLMNALSLSPSDGWAVGERGAMLHLSGQNWSAWPTGSRLIINSVHGTAPDDLWAVGERGYAVHFDGTSWTPRPVPIDKQSFDLASVFAAAADDVWAVGQGGVVLHWNGNMWEDLSGPSNTLHSVFVDEDRTAWIVGASGTFWRATAVGGVLTRNAGLGNVRLRDVSGVGDSLYIVSETGTMASCDRLTAMCSSMASPQDGGLPLSSVHALTMNNIWVTANTGTVHQWQGSTWTQRNPTGVTLNLVRGDADGGVYVVGESGFLKHFPTTGPQVVLNVGTSVHLNSVFSIGGTTLIGGDVGALLKKTQ